MAGSARAGYDQKVINLWTARVIPIIIIGIVGYVSWVIIELVCLTYLLRPAASTHLPRPRSAIAILIVYSILLLLVATTYFRLLYTVTTNPGYVERGPRWYEKNNEEATRKDVDRDAGRLRGHDLRRSRKRGTTKSTTRHSGDPKKHSKRASASHVRNDSYLGGFGYTSQSTASRPTVIDEASCGLQDYYGKDVFVCEGNGRPIWCTSCMNWKPDRAHHCREIDRCVRKMDHFCPWVAGVVGETTQKFFIQFVSWAAVYCIFILIIMAIVTSEERKKNKVPNVHWIVTISLAALFTLFAGGMTGSSLQFAFLNTTTIENLTRRSKVWQLAIYMARPPTGQSGIGFPSVTYPLIDDPSIPQTPNSKRTFAILHSKPGENLWDLGPFENFKSVMGIHWYDWFIPLRYSPCCDHSRGESQFQMGHVVERMREEAGLVPPRDSDPPPSSRWGDYRSRRSKERDSIKADAPQLGDDGQKFPKGRRNDATNDEERNGGFELSDTNAR